MARDLLLEIGTEELPWGAQDSGREQLERNAATLLGNYRLQHAGLEIYSTPRRLALMVRGLEERQADREDLVKGPSRSAAFDAEGVPTKAAEGFTRSKGAQVSDLEVGETEKGEFVFLRVREEGKPTSGVLPALSDELLRSFTFPKSMRWGAGEFRFARPVRWLLALYGSEIIPCRIEGLESSHFTYGHRFLSLNPHVVREPSSYLEVLEKACVIASQDRRRQSVLKAMQEVCDARGLKPIPPAELVDEVVDLTEWPHVLAGTFPEKYTDLPREVLITAMQEHQRYLPTEDSKGNLSNVFLVVQNADPDKEDIIRRGNERVLKARLEDAEFFFSEDGKLTLDARVEGLKKVVYQARLGTYHDKVARLASLVSSLAEMAHADEATAGHALRAARLAKSDLITAMVIEFPSLQGVVGRIYAARDGEAPETARAIEEQYAPRGAGDALPQSPAGALLSLAEKLDNLAGCFSAGLIPSGSEDPYALRRQAQAVFSILLDRGLHLDLAKGLRRALELYAFDGAEEVGIQLQDFMRQRLRHLLLNQDFPYDLVGAVMPASLRDPLDAFDRLRALVTAREEGRLARLYTAFERCYNLSLKGEGLALDESKLSEEAERELHSRAVWAQQPLRDALDASDFSKALEVLAELAPAVDGLFEQTFIMVEDKAVRDNRLALLAEVVSLFAELADFSQVVPEG
jgi:glycyl-tRNA synthetase beta chain